MSIRIHKRTWLFWTAIIAAAGAAIFRGGDWRLIAAHYHIWRLNGALDPSSASPWLERLSVDASEPEAASVLVGKLGDQNPHYTFWIFLALTSRSSQSAFEPPDSIPLLQALNCRLEKDENLLRSWTHFLRWRNQLIRNFDADRLAARPPAEIEREFHLLRLKLLAAVWFLHIDPPPELPDVPAIFTSEAAGNFLKPGGAFQDLQNRINDWIANHQHRLRYDPRLERFMPVGRPDGVTPVNVRAILSPEKPLPDWQGPVPKTQ